MLQSALGYLGSAFFFGVPCTPVWGMLQFIVLVVGDSQVVFGNRVLIKGNLNDAVNVASQHLVSVDVFFQHDAVVVLINHLLLGCAKRVSAA